LRSVLLAYISSLEEIRITVDSLLSTSIGQPRQDKMPLSERIRVELKDIKSSVSLRAGGSKYKIKSVLYRPNTKLHQTHRTKSAVPPQKASSSGFLAEGPSRLLEQRVFPPAQVSASSLAVVKRKNPPPYDSNTGPEDVDEPPPAYTPWAVGMPTALD
jgi:hypothetical protein